MQELLKMAKITWKIRKIAIAPRSYNINDNRKSQGHRRLMHKIYKRELARRRFTETTWCLFILNEAHASAFEILLQREHAAFHTCFLFHFLF